MKPVQEVAVRWWLAEPLPKPVEQALDRLARTDDVCRIAVMPDVHLADDVCIGTVVATTRTIYLDAVGGDIGCGMAAIRFNSEASLLFDERAAAKVLDGLSCVVPSIRHGAASVVGQLPDHLRAMPLSDRGLERFKERDARVQLGTLGRGNHFLEFQADEKGVLWLMVHSGSRSMGPAIRELHLQKATRTATGLWFLESDSQNGLAYLQDLTWALAYAEENRQAMIRATVSLMENLFDITADWSSGFSCHHNHVRQEIHEGCQWWVHRKGAIGAGIGVKGIIPGSMGTASYHVEGRGHAASLESSSHGAGRAMRRGEAHRTIRLEQLKREMKGVWFDQRHLSRLCDEAPSAYKDITHVMRAQRELTKILRVVRPVLSYKAIS